MGQWVTRLSAVGLPLSIIRFFAGLFLPVTVILSASEGSRYKTLVFLLSVTTNRRENVRPSDDRLQENSIVFLSVRGTILPPLAAYILIARRAPPQLSARRAVKPKTPPAKGRSNLRTFLHHPSSQPAVKPRPFAPKGRGTFYASFPAQIILYYNKHIISH